MSCCNNLDVTILSYIQYSKSAEADSTCIFNQKSLQPHIFFYNLHTFISKCDWQAELSWNVTKPGKVQKDLKENYNCSLNFF